MEGGGGVAAALSIQTESDLPMSNRNGFTLIELLIVVVVVGILAAVAIPKFSAAREKAHFSAMKADLRNLQALQEVYYGRMDTSQDPPRPLYKYARSVDDAVLGFSASKGVKIEITDSPDDLRGWSAVATHKAFNYDTERSCVVYVGDAPPLPPATIPDVVVCKGEK